MEQGGIANTAAEGNASITYAGFDALLFGIGKTDGSQGTYVVGVFIEIGGVLCSHRVIAINVCFLCPLHLAR